MAKGQSRRPGRDVRGGSGKRGRDARGHAGGTGPRGLQGARGTGNDRLTRDGRGGTRGRVTRGGGRPSGSHGNAGRSPQGGATYIEGRRACGEALDAGVPIRRALVARHDARATDDADATIARLVDRLAASGIEVESVPRTRLDALSSHGAHQGIVLEVAPFAYSTVDDIVGAAHGHENALVIVCDHVSDEGNLGAIVRSAEIVDAAGVVVARARAAGVGVGAYKTSAGAVLHVPIARVANIATAIDQLKRAGFWAIAATEHASVTAWDAPLAGRIALVMGAEATGVSRLVLERCDLACRLPQRGRIESLNVAQAATVLCYEWLRRSFGGRDVGLASSDAAVGADPSLGPRTDGGARTTREGAGATGTTMADGDADHA